VRGEGGGEGEEGWLQADSLGLSSATATSRGGAAADDDDGAEAVVEPFRCAPGSGAGPNAELFAADPAAASADLERVEFAQARAREQMRRRRIQRPTLGGGGGALSLEALLGLRRPAAEAAAAAAAEAAAAEAAAVAAGWRRRPPAWRSPEAAATLVQAVYSGFSWRRRRTCTGLTTL
jgi:hypothetical protein